MKVKRLRRCSGGLFVTAQRKESHQAFCSRRAMDVEGWVIN